MLRHIGGKHTADANATATAKVQKQIVRDYLAGNGRKQVEGWLPRYLEFPFQGYMKDRGGRLAGHRARIGSLLS